LLILHVPVYFYPIKVALERNLGSSGYKRVVYFVRQRTTYLAGVYFYVDDVISLYFVLVASIL